MWYKYNGSSFVLISRAANGKPDVYEPGTYKVEVCGAYGITIIPEGKVYRNKEITEAVITKFSIFPNPSKNEAVRMLVPTSSISLQSETYKLEVFNTVGTRVLLKDNLQFGNNPSPIITQRFMDPTTRQVDRNQLNNIKKTLIDTDGDFTKAVENGEINPGFPAFWSHQQKEIVKDQLQSKLSTMVSKAMYTPTWMVEQAHVDQNQRVEFEYVQIPFDEIEDSAVELTDADYTNYFNDNKGRLYYERNQVIKEGLSYKFWAEYLPNFTEALWVHKKGEYYYVSYASGFPETIHYAMSKSIHGPWEYKGLLNEMAGNSETNHQSIIEFKGKDYFIYHNAAIQHNSGIGAGGRYRRSVAVDKLEYNDDATIKRIIMTSEGITKPAK